MKLMKIGQVILGISTTFIAINAGYVYLARPWLLRWGATASEYEMSLPGDEIVPDANYRITRAVTVNAPARKVWPWVAQIGQGRGGLYSYDWLENLMACDIHTADRIITEFQNPKVGDQIRLVPDPYRPLGQEIHGGPAYSIARIDPGRTLALKFGSLDSPEQNSWIFNVLPIDENHTRLIARSRTYSDPAWMASVIGVEPIHFMMEQKMLREIKARAERMD